MGVCGVNLTYAYFNCDLVRFGVGSEISGSNYCIGDWCLGGDSKTLEGGDVALLELFRL